jgi:soluble lytic murein transglycosylase-like protein
MHEHGHSAVDLQTARERRVSTPPGKPKATRMADNSAPRPNLFASVACFGVMIALTSCASVTEDAMTAKTITPVTTTEVAHAALPEAKPGTENTAEALPAPVAMAEGEEAVPVSALAEAKPMTGAAAATTELANATTTNELPAGAINVSVMEPGFDSGEPEGLEQLIASRKIVPMAKPAFEATAFAATETRFTVPQAVQPFQKSGTPIDDLITKYAAIYGIPESLLHRVVKRESTYNPRAYNRGHYGLMQIKYATARSMGYEGPAEGLFDAETNIKYAGKYLRGAWMVADDKNDGAVRLYAAGYYYHAKRKGLLDETGLR